MIDSLACALVKLLGAICGALPPEGAVWIGERLGELIYLAQPKRARVGMLNLQAAFDGTLMPQDARRIIRADFRQLGATLIELLRLPAMDRAYSDRYISGNGYEHYDAAVASGRPVMLLSGHYGNWELASIAAALHGTPIVALARAQSKMPKLYALLISYRESKGCTIVHKGGAVRQLLLALDRRQTVGIVGDQASRHGIFVPFFGRPALFATGPFELALKKDVLIIPAFIRRVRGPYHEVTTEPPLTVSRTADHDTAIREAIETFAAIFTRHITAHPEQWLWMHKRWKHTPARKILVLSDGKLGHMKQSLAVVDALRQRWPQSTATVVEIRYRSRWHRTAALLWARLGGGRGAVRCLSWTLAPESARALLTRYADFIISCGAATTPVNVLWAAAQQAKSIALMNPAPFPLSRFALVIAPQHDGLPRRANVVQTLGALASPMDNGALAHARERLTAHPRFRRLDAGGRRPPVIALLIGGDTARYAVQAPWVEALAQQVIAACDRLGGWCMVTTSRRTAPEVEEAVSERFERYPRCTFLLIANRDQVEGTMAGMLGWADLAVVTGESISMVTESASSGRHVIVAQPPLQSGARSSMTKHERFLRGMAHEGYVRVAPVPEIGRTIEQLLESKASAKRLDSFPAVRDAVARLT